MTDSTNKLRDTLVQLHEQLRDTRDVNDETRVLLLEVIDDIRAVISDGAPAHQHGHGTLITRLRAAEHSFEATHPTLSGVISGLIDILGQMGI